MCIMYVQTEIGFRQGLIVTFHPTMSPTDGDTNTACRYLPLNAIKWHNFVPFVKRMTFRYATRIHASRSNKPIEAQSKQQSLANHK